MKTRRAAVNIISLMIPSGRRTCCKRSHSHTCNAGNPYSKIHDPNKSDLILSCTQHSCTDLQIRRQRNISRKDFAEGIVSGKSHLLTGQRPALLTAALTARFSVFTEKTAVPFPGSQALRYIRCRPEILHLRQAPPVCGAAGPKDPSGVTEASLS